MNGIIIIDKPQEWTSNDVVSRLRRVFNTRRIGHGGTLDPMATGVLPVFVGRATRGVEFFEHAEKVYESTIRFGLTTDTEDITGKVLTETEVSLTEEDLQKVLPRFRGEILQVPPMYSAIKVNGQKLYDLARKGREVEERIGVSEDDMGNLSSFIRSIEGVCMAALLREAEEGCKLSVRAIPGWDAAAVCAMFGGGGHAGAAGGFIKEPLADAEKTLMDAMLRWENA